MVGALFCVLIAAASDIHDHAPMTDRQLNTDQTGDQTPLTIAQAADHLGMTSEAVRMRLKRGTINGAKVDGRWVVYLDASEQPPEQRLNTDSTTDQTATEQTPKRDQTSVESVYEALVSSQREEIAFLRSQLDKRSQELADERERSDVLHREAFARIEALTAGISTTVDSDQAPESMGDDLRADSARNLDESPQDADVGPGATTGESPSSESNNGPSTASRSVFGDFVAWMRRR